MSTWKREAEALYRSFVAWTFDPGSAHGLMERWNF